MLGGNSKIAKYKKYLAVSLEEEFGFNKEEIEDILQSVELAKIEAIAKDADEDATYGIIRKAVKSSIKKRIRQREELCVVNVKKGIVIRENDAVNAKTDDKEIFNDTEVNLFLSAFDCLNEKEQGIFMGRFIKGQMSREDVLEYTDVVDKITDIIAPKNSEIANLLYDKLCYMENPHK